MFTIYPASSFKLKQSHCSSGKSIEEEATGAVWARDPWRIYFFYIIPNTDNHESRKPKAQNSLTILESDTHRVVEVSLSFEFLHGIYAFVPKQT